MIQKQNYLYDYGTAQEIAVYGEERIRQQEKMIIANLPVLVKRIGYKLEELDNDCKETIEIELFGISIYVDVKTRGWDYRSIELVAIDIMNDDCDALPEAAHTLSNELKTVIASLNQEMEQLYNEY